MKSLIPMLVLLTACGGPDPRRPADDSAPPVVSCAGGEVMDGDACVPEACGVGTWGNLPIDGNTAYVDAAAGEGGDGSAGAPLASIQAGVDLAGGRGGGLVAVAAGTYVEVIAMGDDHKDVTLAGRCRELVTIDGSDGGKADAAVSIIGGRKTPAIGLEGVTVTGGRYAGTWLEHAAVSLRASDLRGNTLAGIVAVGATVTLDDVGIYDSQPDRTGAFGRGIDAESGTSLTATRSTVQYNTEIGVFAGSAGTVIELVDTDILDTSSSPDGSLGRGIEVEEGAALTATGCTIQGNATAGVLAGGATTTVDLVDTEILDTQPSSTGTLGDGLTAQDGAAVTATGCVVQGNTEGGVAARGVGTVVDLVDTEILDTSPLANGTLGRGIEVEDGAALTATGCTIQGNADVGVAATGAATTVDLQDSAVLDTSTNLAGEGGYGLQADDGAGLSATRCTLQENTEVGALSLGAGTRIDLVETAILDTSPSPDGRAGRGLEASDGATLTATGCTVQGNVDIGVAATGTGTTVELVDTGILDTSPRADGAGGRGLDVRGGAALTATGCTLRGNTELGVAAAESGTTVALIDTDVLDTHRGRSTGFAVGVLAQDGARLTLGASGISGTEGPALYVVAEAQVDADRMTITGNAFAGAVVLAGALTLTSSSITGTSSDVEWGGGIGVYVSDIGGASTLTLLDSTIGPHDYAAVWIDGSGSYDIEDNALSGSAGVNDHGTTIHGNAVFAENGVTAWDEDAETGLLLAANTFSGASEIGVLLDDASATLTGNAWSENGQDLRQQLCDGPDHVHGDVTGEDGAVTNDDAVPLTTEDLVGIPNPLVCPAANVLTSGIVFTTMYLPETATEP